ncbi:ABC transporter ATP-binding protein [Chloroflexi bacterium TSY]|nr:ABC transporter ATP-binding protein [Chloroflexi bacterium TSY]
MAHGAAVRLNNVVKRFGTFTAVDGVSLEIQSGEFLTLLGPSGSGKTTMLSMIAGFETPTEGTIEIGNQRVERLSPEKRNVGMVFQNYALFPHMTVAQNVAFPLRMRGFSRQDIEPKVRSALELVRLPEQAAKYPSQLSGGQQQRVALARALVYEPSVLLMDEPLGALDRRLREIVQLELIELHQSVEATIIYVTHDQEEALTMSDRIAIMNAGHILQVGTPREIYDQPVDTFVADFVGDSTILTGRVQAVNGAVCAIELGDGLTITSHAEGWVQAGADVQLLIRPEKATLSQGNQNHTTASAPGGTLVHALYLGESTRYRVQLDSGHEVLVRAHNRADQSIYRVGDRVFVTWQPADAIILRSEIGD